jgi:8-oxo-dGTP pyrophosphatase MutT (NUDIX family)
MVWLPSGTLTVVLDDDGGRVLLIWRHRFVPDVWTWETPGGLIEEGETAEAAAVREIREETGYLPHSMIHLLTFEPIIALARSPHYVFLARGAELVGAPTERNEGRCQWVPLEEVPARISNGQVLNVGTLVALLYVLGMEGHIGTTV